MKKYSICMIVSLLLPSAAHAAVDRKHPFGTDGAALHRARAIAVAPDGAMILYCCVARALQPVDLSGLDASRGA
jgi:hypothetical protein